jgi:hypothetical protein
MEQPKELNSLRKKLFGNIAPVLSKSASNILSSIPGTTQSAPWKTYLIGALVVIITILIVLLLVHILVTPVFPYTLISSKLSGNAMGIDVEPQNALYWQKATDILNDSSTVIGSGAGASFNYAFTIDIGINPMSNIQFNGLPIIMYHGPQQTLGTGTTVAGTLSNNYNIAIALESAITNDIIISVLNVDNEMENVLLQNVPVGKGFRLGVVLTDRVLEVYINGRLAKTRALLKTPKPVSGYFIPPNESTISIVQVRNLHLFSGPIGAYKMKQIANNPPISTFDFKDANICSSS